MPLVQPSAAAKLDLGDVEMIPHKDMFYYCSRNGLELSESSVGLQHVILAWFLSGIIMLLSLLAVTWKIRVAEVANQLVG
jgi:hypothetical protein